MQLKRSTKVNIMFGDTDYVSLARTRGVRKNVDVIEHKRSRMWALSLSGCGHLNEQFNISRPQFSHL